MKLSCPNIRCLNHTLCSTFGSKDSHFGKDGNYFRKSDSRWIQRYKCKSCGKRFSRATFHPAYRQNKRRINFPLKKLLCSGVSLRRSAKILGVSRLTIVRKLHYLATLARLEHNIFLSSLPKIKHVQFDELQTIEHTKCKPLSVPLLVEKNSRKILAFEVASMPATGKLVKLARKKYGKRNDERVRKINQLFKKIQSQLSSHVVIDSDEHPFYPPIVKKFFPHALHQTTKGRRSSVAGQGELKKILYDPLFSLNHTCAMLRANINRLFRKTWCTTKCPKCLENHLIIYINFHNQKLTT